MDSIFPNTAIHGEVKAGRASSVRKELKNLTINMNVSLFDMAELLYEAQINSYFLQWGYESLGDYAAKELSLKERKSQYLSRIIKVCKEIGLKREHFEPAGVSKLREICTLNPDDSYFDKEKNQNSPMDEHIVDLIAEAPEMSITEVKEVVAKLKGQVDENRQVVRSFGCTQSCWDNTIRPALELAARKLGSAGRDNSGNAVEYSEGAKWEIICISFLQDPNNFIEDQEHE